MNRAVLVKLVINSLSVVSLHQVGIDSWQDRFKTIFVGSCC